MRCDIGFGYGMRKTLHTDPDEGTVAVVPNTDPDCNISCEEVEDGFCEESSEGAENGGLPSYPAYGKSRSSEASPPPSTSALLTGRDRYLSKLDRVIPRRLPYGVRSALDRVIRLYELVYVLVMSGDECEGHKMISRVYMCEKRCETPRVITDACNRLVCRHCGPARVHDNAMRATERYAGWLKVNRKRYRPKHIEVSPPPLNGIVRLVRPGGLAELRRELYDHLRSAGLRAWAVVFHPYRVEDWAKAEFAKAKKGGYQGGLWDYIRERGWDRDVSDLNHTGAIYPSPHFHVFGYGYMEQSDKFYERTGGWVYKNIRTLDTDEDIYKAIRYALSHGGLILKEKGRQANQVLTWGGELSYNRFAADKIVISEFAECPVCGEPQYMVAPMDLDVVVETVDGCAQRVVMRNAGKVRLLYHHPLKLKRTFIRYHNRGDTDRVVWYPCPPHDYVLSIADNQTRLRDIAARAGDPDYSDGGEYG